MTTRLPTPWQLTSGLGCIATCIFALLGGSPWMALAWAVSFWMALAIPHLLLWWHRPSMRARAIKRVLRRQRREAREQAAQAYLAQRRQLLALPGRN